MDRREYVRWGVVVATGLAIGGAPAPGADAQSAPGLGSAVTGVHRFERGLVVLSGERVRVRARVRNAPAGSVLVVRVVQHGRDLRVRRSAVTGSRNVRLSVRAPRPGLIVVRIRLAGPDGRALLRRPAVRVGVLAPTASAGARGTRVRFLQRGLSRLRYAVAATGVYDEGTRRAVIAFRKVNRLARVSNASRAVFAKVARHRGAFRPRHGGAAHVEGDLTRQVLALVNRGGRVFKVYMTSSGRPSLRTPTGVHRFYRKEAGWNSSGMLDSAYFTHPSGPRTACAIHGYFVVPIWNASHCCFRVPVADARKIFNWVRLGQRIYVYY